MAGCGRPPRRCFHAVAVRGVEELSSASKSCDAESGGDWCNDWWKNCQPVNRGNGRCRERDPQLGDVTGRCGDSGEQCRPSDEPQNKRYVTGDKTLVVGSVQVGVCKPVIDPMGVVRAATVTIEIAHDTINIIIKNIK